MMWSEFEEIAGYRVSYETYSKIIEPMYMAIPDSMSKKDFIALLNRKALEIPSPERLMKEVKKEAKHLCEICGHYSDYESESRMEKAAKQYAKEKYGLDWVNDSEVYVYFLREYEYPAIGRGCTYPKTLVIGRNSNDFLRVELN